MKITNSSSMKKWLEIAGVNSSVGTAKLLVEAEAQNTGPGLALYTLTCVSQTPGGEMHLTRGAENFDKVPNNNKTVINLDDNLDARVGQIQPLLKELSGFSAGGTNDQTDPNVMKFLKFIQHPKVKSVVMWSYQMVVNLTAMA